MGRASVAAAGFALSGGSPADLAGVVHVARGPDPFGRILLACVEPLDSSPRGMELAGVALRVIRETFLTTPGAPADALLTAFGAANAAVMAENRPLATGRWERRICVGATGIVLAGREIIVAQALPSQAILVQDGQVYPFPDVASWRGDYVSDGPLTESHPLGFVEEIVPRLYQSEAAPGDLIALCATSAGRALGRNEDVVVHLFGGSLLTGDLEGSVDRLERLLAEHDVTDTFAVVAAVSRLPRRPRTLGAGPRSRLPEPAEPIPPNHGTTSHAQPVEIPVTTYPTVASAPFADERLPLFEGLRDRAIDMAELFSAHRQQRTGAYAARQRALAAPGALSVRRYREASGLPAEWRANLPRGPGVHVPARLLAVSLVLFLTLGGTGIAAVRQRDREAQARTALVAAETALGNALQNSGSAMSLVAEAERAVEVARQAGAADAPLARVEQELATVRDKVWGVQRFGEIVRIGALPDDAAAGPVGLALSGRTLYLAAGNLYEIDQDGGRLVTLLTRGDAVGDGVAGDLRHVSINGGNVVASDGTGTYQRDKTGKWQRTLLAVSEVGGLQAELPIITWGDASYGLSWESDLVRFNQETSGPLAEIWADAAASPDLELARDLAIDGRIHLLLEDGRILTYSRGALMSTIAPFVVPALEDPAFLAEAPFATAFYVVDRNGQIGENTGRIVRVDATGDARQILTPTLPAGDPLRNAVASSLANARGAAIDELTGTVYWVSGGELWRASLPLG